MRINRNRLISFLIMTAVLLSCMPMVYATGTEGYRAVNVDDNFIRLELSDREFQANGERTFDFTPTKTDDYAFFFDYLTYDTGDDKKAEPNIDFKVMSGDMAVDLSYLSDDTEDYYKYADEDFDLNSKETLPSEFTTTQSFSCNVNHRVYYRVGDRLSLKTTLMAGKTYTISVKGDAYFMMNNIDVRALTIPIKRKDTQISVLDFNRYKLGGGANRAYTITNVNSWERNNNDFEPFDERYDIAGDYRSRSLQSPKTKTNVFSNGNPTYKIKVEEAGEYTFTVHTRSIDTILANTAITDSTGAIKTTSKALRIEDLEGNMVAPSSSNKEWLENINIENNESFEAYLYDSRPAFTATLSEGEYLLIPNCAINEMFVYAITIDYTGYDLINEDYNCTRFVRNSSDSSKNIEFTTANDVKTFKFTPKTTGNYMLIPGTETNVSSISYKIGDNDAEIEQYLIADTEYTITINCTPTRKYGIVGDYNTATLAGFKMICCSFDVGDGKTKIPDYATQIYIKDTGKYKLRVYAEDGAMIADTTFGDLTKTADTYESEAVELTAGEDITLSLACDKTIEKIEIEKVSERLRIDFDENIWIDSDTPIGYSLNYDNVDLDDRKFYAARYSSNGRFEDLKSYNLTGKSGNITDSLARESTSSDAKLMLWNGNCTPYQNETKLFKPTENEIVLTVGITEGDFETIEAAFTDIADKLETDYAGKNIYLVLAPGEHFIEDTISLDCFDGDESLTVMSLSKTNKAMVSGAMHIEGSEFSDENNDGIYEADIPGGTLSRQMFVDGMRAVRARSVGELPDAELKRRYADGSFPGVDAEFQTDQYYTVTTSEHLESFSKPQELELVFHDGWLSRRIMADSIEWDNNIAKACIIFEGDNKANWKGSGFMSAPNHKPQTPDWIENALELLDEPGEFYIDSAAGKAYYMPREFESMTDADVVIPVTEQLFTASGTYERPVKNITFKDIEFAYTTWLRPTTDRVFRSGQNECDSSFSDTGALMDGAIELNNVNNIDFDGCDFTHLGAIALKMVGAVQNCDITETEFYDISANAIAMGEVIGTNTIPITDVKNPSPDKAVMNNVIKNNYIHNVAVDYTSATALSIGYAENVQVINNELCDGSYSGMHIGWGWEDKDEVITKNLDISKNYIHDFMNADLYDGAAVYTLGRTNGSAYNYLRNNYIADVKCDGRGIYPDQGSSYWEFSGNVVDVSGSDDGEWLHNWWETPNHLRTYGNFSTTEHYIAKAQYSEFNQAHVYALDNMPAEARAIMANSGIEKPAQHRFNFGLQKVKSGQDRYILSGGDSADLNLQGYTSKGRYDLSTADIYIFSSNPDVVTITGQTVTANSAGNTVVHVMAKTINNGRSELYSLDIPVTVQ